VGQGDDPGAHQRAVAGGVVVAGGEAAGGVDQRRARRSAGPAGGAQDGAGLGADVSGAAAQPALEVGGDRVKGLGSAQVRPGAATSAIHTCIWVSSEYSPGSYGPRPPPIICGCWSSRSVAWNS
jgi:hypothetical protein